MSQQDCTTEPASAIDARSHRRRGQHGTARTRAVLTPAGAALAHELARARCACGHVRGDHQHWYGREVCMADGCPCGAFR